MASPYLKSGRLGEVLAAIQAMGASEDRYARSCEAWSKIIGGNGRELGYWKKVFDEHPEFFRKIIRKKKGEREEGEEEGEEERYAMIWRMAYKQEPGTPARRVLGSQEIKLLCDMAVNMHAKAVEERRWWVAPVLSFVGALLGALIAFAGAGLFRGTAH
jgi:hypothetical protein